MYFKIHAVKLNKIVCVMSMSTVNMNRNSMHCAVGIEKIRMGWQSFSTCAT
jgi:hypothetical protein